MLEDEIWSCITKFLCRKLLKVFIMIFNFFNPAIDYKK